MLHTSEDQTDMHFLREVSSMTTEWSVENTRIVCELFAVPVNAGNRPGNYLTPSAFDEVTRQFNMRTGLTTHRRN